MEKILFFIIMIAGGWIIYAELNTDVKPISRLSDKVSGGFSGADTGGILKQKVSGPVEEFEEVPGILSSVFVKKDDKYYLKSFVVKNDKGAGQYGGR